MKKPVKPVGNALDAIVAKRKHKLITVTKPIPAGTLADVTNAVSDFAVAQGVPTTEVKFGDNGWYGGGKVLKVRRPETDAEKRKRVAQDENYKYQNKMYKYRRWQSQEAARKEQEARANENLAKNAQKAIDKNVITVKCTHVCGCK